MSAPIPQLKIKVKYRPLNMQTIDVDRNRVLERIKIAYHILKCPAVYSVKFERSPSRRGWHVMIFCNRPGCEKCRRLFDDPVRFAADHDNRLPHQRNVLFDQKTLYFPEVRVIKKFRKTIGSNTGKIKRR